MRRNSKIAVIIILQIMVSILLLEAFLRLISADLPARLQPAVQRIMTGERFEIDNVFYMQTNGVHGMALLPDLEDVSQMVSPSVQFQFSTRSLWSSDIGFRNRPIDYTVETVVVGDSFSFCFTSIEHCWVTHYERDTGLGTVNLAQPGTASTSHLHMLERYARPLQPRLILWQFFGNDFNEEYGFAVARGDIHVDEPEQATALVTPPRPEDTNLIGWLRQHSLIFALIDISMGNDWAYISDYQRLYVEPYHVTYGEYELRFGQPYELQVFDLSDKRNQIGITYTREALRQAKALVNEWGGHLAVIIMPTRELVYEHLTAPFMGEIGMAHHQAPRQTMLAICEELQLLCFDPLPLLQQHAQQGGHLYYTDDLHLNPYGNQVLAELIWRWLGGYGILYSE